MERLRWMFVCLATLLAGCGTGAPAGLEVGTERDPSAPEVSSRLLEVWARTLELADRPRTEAALEQEDWIDRFLIFDYTEADRQDRALLEFLYARLEAPDPVLSTHALLALATLQAPGLFSRLVDTLRDHPNGFIRGYAALALGKLGDRRAVPHLERALGDPFITRQGDRRLPFVSESARAALLALR